MADIIISYCEPIDSKLVTSKHHFVNYLAKQGHRILYLEAPHTPLSFIKYLSQLTREKTKSYFRPKRIQENIWSMTGMYPLPYHRGLFDHLILNKINQVFYRFFIQRAMQKLNFKNCHHIIYYPHALPILKSLSPNRVLIHIVDDWESMSGIPNSLEILVRRSIKHADCVVVTAHNLYEKYRLMNSNTHLLQHGSHVNMYKDTSTHKKNNLSTLNKNKPLTIGYYGSLGKLDFQLIRFVSRSKPEWTFIFHGPTSGAQGLKLQNIHDLPDNVSFPGPIPHSETPAFLGDIDVFWMPFVDNTLTQAMCPIKLFEAAAANTPTVSTKLNETVPLSDLFYFKTADTPQMHLDALEQAHQSETHDIQIKRESAIKNHDWKSISQKFESYLIGI